jgi:hypothetical protein
MCCFSGPVEDVSSTKIFARKSGKDTQFLVYQMNLRTSQKVAMILPLPVAHRSRAKAVRFISLKHYPDFFDDMRMGFPQSKSRSAGAMAGMGGASKSDEPLPVVKVGDFIASYVPSILDFSRVDKRFKLPKNTWEALPDYSNYGFAVFQLNIATNTDTKIHPMALEFVTELQNKLFFPTVHIHDGKVHSQEHFDHSLYLQEEAIGLYKNLAKSIGPANTFMRNVLAKGITSPEDIVYRRILRGTLPNEDTLFTIG